MHNKTSPNFFGEAPNSLIWEGREVELASSQPFPAEGLRHGMTTEVPGGTIRRAGGPPGCQLEPTGTRKLAGKNAQIQLGRTFFRPKIAVKVQKSFKYHRFWAF